MKDAGLDIDLSIRNRDQDVSACLDDELLQILKMKIVLFSVS